MASTSLGNVYLVSGQTQTGVAGEDISCGDFVCIYQGKLAKATTVDVAKSVAVGVCLSDTVEGLQCIYAAANAVVSSATASNASQESIWYVDSTTAGNMCLFADIPDDGEICAVCSAGDVKNYFKIQVKSTGKNKDADYAS